MAIPLIWVEQRELPLSEAVEGICTNCGAQSLQSAFAQYATVVYLFVFGFLKRLEVVGRCPACGRSVTVPESMVPGAVRKQVPALHRFGCAIIAVLGLFFGLVMAVINNSR
jgi:hypothetical protein